MQQSQVKQIFFESIDSTQDYTKANLQLIDDGWLAVRAREQTKGRGQGTNSWVSLAGKNIYVTYSFRWAKEQAQLIQYLPQTSILSVFQAVQELNTEKKAIQIKWINDLLINNKKVSGVLCESIEDKDELVILIGIGVNIDLESVNIPDSGNLEKELQKVIDENKFYERLTDILSNNIKILQSDGFKQLLEIIQDNLYKKGEPVILKDYQQSQTLATGTLIGLDQHGHLLIRNADGLIENHISGRLQH